MFSDEEPTIDRLQLFAIKGYLCTWLSDSSQDQATYADLEEFFSGVRETFASYLMENPDSTLHDHFVRECDARVQVIYHDDGSICSFIIAFDPRGKE